jgi:hypothetical protein
VNIPPFFGLSQGPSRFDVDPGVVRIARVQRCARRLRAPEMIIRERPKGSWPDGAGKRLG